MRTAREHKPLPWISAGLQLTPPQGRSDSIAVTLLRRRFSWLRSAPIGKAI
jgi:hypothetical protein